MSYKKYAQMIRQGFLSVVSDDTSEFPIAQITSNGRASDVVRLSPYGLLSNPPQDSHVLLFQAQCDESVKFGIFSDTVNRKRGLEAGECALYNSLTGAIVYMKADGSIAIESDASVNVSADSEVTIDAPTINASGDNINAVATAAANITAPTITLNGNVVVNGAIAATGVVAAAGFGGAGGAPADMPDGADIGGIAFDVHVHGGVQSGGSNTGVPQ